MIVDLYTMNIAPTNNPSNNPSNTMMSPASHNEGGGAGQFDESSTPVTKDMLAHLTTKFPDLPADRLTKIAEEIFKAHTTQKTRRKVKEVHADNRCMARMWRTDTHDDEGDYVYGQPCQCSRRHKDGRFCGQHGKAHAECSQPLQFTNTGPQDYKRSGLFHGAVDEDLPVHDAEGRLVIFWNDPTAKAWVKEQKASGAYTEHPAWISAGGNVWLGGTGALHDTKKRDSSKTAKTKKAKGSVASAIGVKQKRGLSPYFCFLAKHRETIKDELEATEAAAAADEGRSPNTIKIGPVCKEAGVRWNALKAQCEALDDDGCPNDVAIAEMNAHNSASIASKAKADKVNAAAEKAAVGSLDEQIAALQALKAQGGTVTSPVAPKNESEVEKWQAAIDDGSAFSLDSPSLLTPAMLIANNAE
jgi:hypothetical protein